jgi:hypothetical protein
MGGALRMDGFSRVRMEYDMFNPGLNAKVGDMTSFRDMTSVISPTHHTIFLFRIAT